jgi:alanine racemase
LLLIPFAARPANNLHQILANGRQCAMNPYNDMGKNAYLRAESLMSRPIYCQISIAALQHNLRLAKQKAGQHKIWAVIKADAYGHGIANALKGFAAADGLAMLDFSDAVLCRKLGWSKPILMLEGAFDIADVELALSQQFELVVHSQYQLDWIRQFYQTASRAVDGSKPLRTNLKVKVNTGMNRLGFSPSEVAHVLQTIQSDALAKEVVLVTHFANADMSHADGRERPMVEPGQQLKVFVGIGASPIEGSIANSAAVLTEIQTGYSKDGEPAHSGWMRPGIMLYGATPFAHRTAVDEGLVPAMEFGSRIIAVQHLKQGDQVGYGSRFTAPNAMRIGIVACGYADGYPRHAGNATPIAVDRQRTVTVGRVSMDMLAVDLTLLPNSDVGSSVQLWGDIVPVDEVAQAADTIGYELLSAIAPRVRRVVIE